MGQSPSAVRRVPMLLTALSAVVLLIAMLGVVGVLHPPTLSAASAQLSAETPADRAAREAAGSDATDSTADDSTGTDSTGEGAVGAALEGAASEGDGLTEDSVVVTGEAAVDQLVSTATSLINTLSQPAADAATPEPVDSALVPAAPVSGADPAALPADSGAGRRVVYSIHGQRVWVVEEDGTVTRTYPVSGRLDRPGPGTYEVYSKSPTAISYDYSETMKYMIRFAHGERAAIGFHDIPVLDDGTPAQTVEELGQPLSAGCIRQAEADAQFLWDWAALGTAVVVVA